MSRPRRKPTLPVPDRFALEDGDLVVLVPVRDPSLPFVFGQVYDPPLWVNVRLPDGGLVKDLLHRYVIHAVDRGGVRVAKVHEPEYNGLWCRRVPDHPGMYSPFTTKPPMWARNNKYRPFYNVGWRKEPLLLPGMPKVLTKGGPCLWTLSKPPDITARAWFVAPGAWAFTASTPQGFHMGQKKNESAAITAAYTHVLDALRVAS